MAYDEDIAARIRAAIGKRPSISEKKMFGGIAFLRQRHVRPMDFTGKPLKGYVYVAAAGCRTKAATTKWVEKSLSFVKTLPAKK